MQNDNASIRSFRTGLFARRTGFATAARAGTTGTLGSKSATVAGASSPKSMNVAEPTTSAAIDRPSLAALSFLSGATDVRTSTTTTTHGSTANPVATSRTDDRNNPFLQRPARKLFKPDNQSHGDTPSSKVGATTTATSNIPTSSNATSNLLFSMPHSRNRATAAAPKPNTERLTLTRVMPLNSPTKPGAKSTVSVSHQEEEASRPRTFSLFGQSSAPTKTMTPATQSNKNMGHGPHGSTTPKMTPNPKYFEVLSMSQHEPAPKLDLLGPAEDSSSASNLNDQDLCNKGQEEEEDPASTAAAAFSSTTLAFARKSIMRHARTKPQTILQSVARAAEEHKGSPSYSTLLSVSTYAPRLESPPSTSAASHISAATTSTAKGPGSFATNPPAVSSSINTTTSNREASASGQKNPGSSFRLTTPAPVPVTVSEPVLAPISESRGVLDFSGRTDPAKVTASATSMAPINTRSEFSESQEQHKKASVTSGQSSAMEEAGPSQSCFDLRAALLSESSRSTYGLPALTASQAPDPHTGFYKAAPYQVPSTKERQEMRANRRPGHKALPLNPKIFTSAGDLGVPRIPKAPLTVPRSPKFSKIRSRNITSAAAATTTGPTRTTFTNRAANLVRLGGQSDVRPTQTRAAGISSATTQALMSFAYTKPTPPPQTDTAAVSAQSETSNELPRRMEAFSTIHDRQAPKDDSRDVQSHRAPKNKTHDGPSMAGTYRPQVKRPLTQPIPFKFATDSLLRKRTAYEPTSVSSFRLEHAKPSTSRPPKPPSAPYQRPLKRLTVPRPFTFQTDIRAEMHHSNLRGPSTEYHQHQQHHQHPMRGVIPREMLSSRPSRLSNLLPVARLNATAATATAPRVMTATGHQPSVRPPRITVPVSPRLGRDPKIRVVRPIIPFIPKKSTKELTQPVGFRFNTDERLEVRRAHVDAEAEDNEHKIMEARRARQQALDQKLATRERLESTFKARPIAHYPPIHIRPARKALTVPVSPLIGDKRKRYEAVARNPAVYDVSGDEFENRDGFQAHHRDAEEEIEHSQIYRQFEEGRLMQEQQESLKRQLKDQEIRQLELANSSHANVQQPPLRISFPFDPETQALQQEDGAPANDGNGSLDFDQPREVQQQQQPRGRRTLPTSQVSRRTSGGAGNWRVSLETSKAIELGSPRRISGRAKRTSCESSPERGRDAPSMGSVYEPYYAFSRSMERTTAPEAAVETAAATAAPRMNNISTNDGTQGKASEAKVNDHSTPPVDANQDDLGQNDHQPPASTTMPAPTVAIDTLPIENEWPRPQQDEEDPNRRRSGSFFHLDKEVPPASLNATEGGGGAVPRRVSMGIDNDPDRRRSGSFVPLEATTKSAQDVKGKGKKKETTATTTTAAARSTTTPKAKQSMSALITGAAQKHRLPIPSNPTRGRILPGTLGIRPSTGTGTAASTVAKDTPHPSLNSAAGRTLSLSDLL
ncbi:hypothetical protein DFQ27_008286 [Actinomortierella ambigua]|uniref:TPX2 C-terminal domain-containing protein n=1 Tax=Actinomortierella ambigua TaxID=1343610 RepID=A0A9P6UAJ6_9FUNG|nr:hypothetical protein DFQ27_008286 [Actinomortierella ambigua]